METFVVLCRESWFESSQGNRGCHAARPDRSDPNPVGTDRTVGDLMEFPYEGDLLAVSEGVALLRVIQEALDYISPILGIPNIQVQVDEILDDAWWSRRMMQR